MSEMKYAKNLLTSDKVNPVFPAYRHKEDPRYVKRIVQLDGETVPGAEFYSEAKWILPGDKSKEGIILVDSHTHAWGEFIGFFGYDYENILDLGAEIEFTVDNEKHLITRSFGAFIPAGIQHGPLIIRNVVKPIFHFTGGDTNEYK
jgi:hypothetical protein